WKYLSMTLSDTVVCPQKLTIRTEINTLNGVQKLVGDIQWVHNLCGITVSDLQPLFDLLKDGSQPQEP
ncbi:POK18 protein, partial [Neodrepanis coruscans]|nr:POK18 protein [Neodrepanis coruscans]